MTASQSIDISNATAEAPPPAYIAVETSEKLTDAAIRELYEESGILSTSIYSYLGLHYPSELRPNWHVFVCHTTEALKDNCTNFCNDDGRFEFKFFWYPSC